MISKFKSTAKFFIATGTVLCATSILADEVVPVASLEVKERIRSIDQINVTAETDKLAEAPSTAAVAALLDEAARIDAHTTEPQAD